MIEREVTFTHKRTGAEETVTAYRTWWERQEAPHFDLKPDGFLDRVIPAFPSFGGAGPALRTG